MNVNGEPCASRGARTVREGVAPAGGCLPHENGINVSLGHDDIYDPFYPMGDGNMVDVLSMGLHLCHMMGYGELNQSYQMITHNGAKTLHLNEAAYGIEVGKPANFNIFYADSFFDVLRSRQELRYGVRKGKIIKGEVSERGVQM